jgi:RHS repeat-associated protein
LKVAENNRSVTLYRKKTGAVAYRFGFNGKEKDNDVKGGEGLQQDYGMRIYDTRLGRFLSVDPIASDFPWYTPFQFAGNTPLQAIDLDGLEPSYVFPDSRGNWQMTQAGDNLARNRLPVGHQQFMLNNMAVSSKNTNDNQFTQFLDFTPFVGQVKGVIQMKTGNDIITGRELSFKERLLGGLGGMRGRGPTSQPSLNKVNSKVVKEEVEQMETTSARKSLVLRDGVGGQAANNKAIVLNPQEQAFINNYVAYSTGPGFSASKFDKALSTDALRELSVKLGNVEVAQVFVKQKTGGYYSILSGNSRSIRVDNYLDGTPYLISHVHPSGNPFPSMSDQNLLEALKKIQLKNGMPAQKSSQIIPLGQSNKKFNKETKTVGE